MTKSHHHYSSIEKLLLAIIILLIGFIVTYVGLAARRAQRLEQLTYTSELKNPEPNKRLAKPDVAAKWRSYTGAGNEYGLQLADGWQLSHPAQSAALFAYGNASLMPKPGSPAVVIPQTGGKDGSGAGLTITFTSEASKDATTTPSGQRTSFKTNAGDMVQKYTAIETTSGNFIGQVDKGGVYYNYVISHGPNKVLFTYAHNQGEPDYSATVEQVIRTLTIK